MFSRESFNMPILIKQASFDKIIFDLKRASTGRRLQYAKVCLNKPNDIYAVGTTNANGQVTFTVAPQTTGMMKVTVTRLHNADNNYTQYRPSQTTCQVIGGGGSQSSDSSEILPTTLCITGLPAIVKSNITVAYGIPEQVDISIVIYDATGSKVKTIIHPDLRPGYYKESVDAKDLSCGVHFVVLKQNNEQISKKFPLIR